MKIIFFGTPEFAEIILDKLIKSGGFEIVGVVSTPDKQIGRKKVLTSPPVKILAEKNNLKILQPEKLDENFISELKKIKADLFIVAAYGKIIPKEILEIPEFGILNVHPSLLPKYRGASPIQTALLNGDKETGITIMKMDEKMDHGAIVHSTQITVNRDENYITLSKKLAEKSAEILIDVIPKYISGEIKLQEQNHSDATFCKIIKKEDGEIDWNKSAEEIYNQWRAFVEYPGIFSELKVKKEKSQKVKFIEIKVAEDELNFADKKLGEFFVEDKRLFVRCGKDSVLEILKLQPQGKNIMDAVSFINGYLR